jgi:hypothetical protein
MIDHSQGAYTALPAELYKRHRARYSRSPRTMPYPAEVTRSAKSGVSPRGRIRTDSIEHALALLPPTYEPVSRATRNIQESPTVSHMGIVHSASPAPTLASPGPLSPLVMNIRPSAIVKEGKSLKQTMRRSALGWGRKKPAGDTLAVPTVASNGKMHVFQSSSATTAKENVGVGMSTR